MLLWPLTAALADEQLPDGVTPVVLHVVMTGLTQVLAMEDGLGITAGHAETVALVERMLDQFEPEA